MFLCLNKIPLSDITCDNKIGCDVTCDIHINRFIIIIDVCSVWVCAVWVCAGLFHKLCSYIFRLPSGSFRRNLMKRITVLGRRRSTGFSIGLSTKSREPHKHNIYICVCVYISRYMD